jgi:hypothetical protein
MINFFKYKKKGKDKWQRQSKNLSLEEEVTAQDRDSKIRLDIKEG